MIDELLDILKAERQMFGVGLVASDKLHLDLRYDRLSPSPAPYCSRGPLTNQRMSILFTCKLTLFFCLLP